jgi:hypothetical protein
LQHGLSKACIIAFGMRFDQSPQDVSAHGPRIPSRSDFGFPISSAELARLRQVRRKLVQGLHSPNQEDQVRKAAGPFSERSVRLGGE